MNPPVESTQSSESPPSTLHLHAAEAARRARRQSARYRREQERALVERFRLFLEAVLEAVELSSPAPVERFLDGMVSVRSRQGFRPSDFALAFREAEAALRELVTVGEGAQAVGSERWQVMQSMLRHGERYFLARVEGYLEATRSADERRLEALLEALPLAVALVDEGQLIHFTNGRMREFFGIDPADALGRRTDEVISEAVLRRFADPDAFVSSTRRIWAHPERAHDDELRLADGRRLRRQVLPLTGQGSAGSLLLFTDITPLREREEQIAALLGRLVTAQERERSLIASELHDGAVQVLSASLLRLDDLHSRLEERGEAELAERTGELVSDLRAAYEEARSLLFNLRPYVLEEEGLAAALRELLARFEADTQIETRLVDELGARPRRNHELLTFRVLQEALSNVRKHARARSVSIRLQGAGDLQVEVRDDGRGFDPKLARERLRAGHLGLVSMRERVELAGGTFVLQSEPGRGTTISLSLPRLAS